MAARFGMFGIVRGRVNRMQRYRRELRFKSQPEVNLRPKC